MRWARILGTLLSGALMLAACSSAATPPTGSGAAGGSAAPSASSQGVSLGSPSESPSSAPSGSAPAGSASGATPIACDLVAQPDASAAVGIAFPVGKDTKPKLSAHMVVHTGCYYTNGASPAANVLVELVTWEPSFPVATVEEGVRAQILSRVGTHGTVTLAASNATIAGNPGLTSLETGNGVGGVPIHIEVAAFWKGQTVVTLTVGNSKLGAALTLAQLVASKLP
jgi:hypothetical protein